MGLAVGLAMVAGIAFADPAEDEDKAIPLPEDVTVPGSAWTVLRYPSSIAAEEEEQDLLFEGAIRQDLAVLTLDPLPSLIPFVQAGFKIDSERLDYNNKAIVGAGLRFSVPLLSWGQIDAGGKYEVQYFSVTSRSYHGPTGFVEWSGWFEEDRFASEDPGVRSSWPPAIRASTWGTFRYPSDLTEEERENWIVEGAVEAGIDLFALTRAVRINTFVSVGYKADQDKFDYNNEIEVGVGPRLLIIAPSIGRFGIGVAWTNSYRFESRRRATGWVGFATFSTNWDVLFGL